VAAVVRYGMKCAGHFPKGATDPATE
jgi:hypothetical protein